MSQPDWQRALTDLMEVWTGLTCCPSGQLAGGMRGSDKCGGRERKRGCPQAAPFEPLGARSWDRAVQAVCFAVWPYHHFGLVRASA